MKKAFHNKPLSIRFFDDFDKQYFDFFGQVDEFRRKYYFYLKLQAMVCSKFQRVLLVDGDAFLLQDPRFIVDSKMAQQTGALFWHDIYAVHSENPIWKLMGVKPRQGLAQESGAVFINKEIAWEALYLAAYMNNKQSIFNRMLWGDKDTFFIACERMGVPYTFVPYPPYSVGFTRLTQIAFLQSDPEGVPFLLHLVSGKKCFGKLLGIEKFRKVLIYNPDNAHLYVTRLGILFFVSRERGGWSKYISAQAIGNVHMFIGKVYKAASQELKALPSK